MSPTRRAALLSLLLPSVAWSAPPPAGPSTARSGPRGTVRIEADGPTAKDLLRVHFEPAGDGAVARVCLVFDAAWCDKYVPLRPELDLRLPGYDGRYTLAVFLQGPEGGEPEPIQFKIVIDRTPPRVRETKAARTPEGVAVRFKVDATGRDDGTPQVRVTWAEADGSPSCMPDAPTAWSGTGTEALITTLPDDRPVQVAVCAADAAGNVARGTPVLVEGADRDPPVVTAVALAGGATEVATPEVLLDVTATDRSGVDRVCVTSKLDPVCSWGAFTGQVAARVPVDRAEAVLFVRVTDATGRESEPFEVALPVAAALVKTDVPAPAAPSDEATAEAEAAPAD